MSGGRPPRPALPTGAADAGAGSGCAAAVDRPPPGAHHHSARPSRTRGALPAGPMDLRGAVAAHRGAGRRGRDHRPRRPARGEPGLARPQDADPAAPAAPGDRARGRRRRGRARRRRPGRTGRPDRHRARSASRPGAGRAATGLRTDLRGLRGRRDRSAFMSCPTPTLDAIARPSGGLAMVAMDQRESLRTMFDASGAGRVADDVLIDFKLAVADALGPLASGFLIDRHYGFDRIRDDKLLPDSCGLILAPDELDQAAGRPVEETDLDEVV